MKDPRRDEDEYHPAERPADAVGGDRVRFEREGDVEQGIFGGSALDVEAGIWANQAIVNMLIGRTVIYVATERGAMGAGSLHEIKLGLNNGKTIVIRGVGLTIEEAP